MFAHDLICEFCRQVPKRKLKQSTNINSLCKVGPGWTKIAKLKSQNKLQMKIAIFNSHEIFQFYSTGFDISGRPIALVYLKTGWSTSFCQQVDLWTTWFWQFHYVLLKIQNTGVQQLFGSSSLFYQTENYDSTSMY